MTTTDYLTVEREVAELYYCILPPKKKNIKKRRKITKIK